MKQKMLKLLLMPLLALGIGIQTPQMLPALDIWLSQQLLRQPKNISHST